MAEDMTFDPLDVPTLSVADVQKVGAELRRRGDEALRLAGHEASKPARGFLKGASAAFHEAADLISSRRALEKMEARRG